MPQPLRALFPISPPDPFRLPVTQPQDCRCVDQVKASFSTRANTPARLSSLLLIAVRSNQTSFRVFRLGDISNEGKRGHYHSGATAGKERPGRACPARSVGEQIRTVTVLAYEHREPLLDTCFEHRLASCGRRNVAYRTGFPRTSEKTLCSYARRRRGHPQTEHKSHRLQGSCLFLRRRDQ